MAVITMEEVFRHAEAFERMLSDFYGELDQADPLAAPALRTAGCRLQVF